MVKKKDTVKRKWGKVGKASLTKLIRDGDVTIDTDVDIEYIDNVQKKYFPHLDRHNFHRNFRDFAARWDTEQAQNGVRKRELEGKWDYYYYYYYLSNYLMPTPFHQGKIRPIFPTTKKKKTAATATAP